MSKMAVVLRVFVAAWIACGCTLTVFGDNLDPVARHQVGPGYAVVFSGLTVKREAAVGLELFTLGEETASASRRAMLVADQGAEVVAAYLRPGKFEIGGIQLKARGGDLRSASFERHRRDGYAYFRISAGACNWIGDYVVDAGSARGASVIQVVDQQSFDSTSAVFRERFADLARRCSVRNAVIER